MIADNISLINTACFRDRANVYELELLFWSDRFLSRLQKLPFKVSVIQIIL